MVTDSDGFSLPRESSAFLGFAVAAFAVASVLALWTNRPMNYDEPSAVSLKELIEDPENRTEPLSDAIYEVALVQIDTLATYRKINGHKAGGLSLALGAEVIGIVLIALSVLGILCHS